MQIGTSLGARRELVLAYEFLGDLARAQGDWAGARAEWTKALELGEQIAPRGDVTGEPLRRMAEAELHDGAVSEALRFARRALDVNRSCGDRKEEASTLRVFGDIARALGRRGAARKAYRASIAMLASMGARGELALSEQALGALTAEEIGVSAGEYGPDSLNVPLSEAGCDLSRDRTDPSGGEVAARPGGVESRAADYELFDSDVAFTIREEGWDFLTRDRGMQLLVARIKEISATRGTVLLLGETGTGKELLARLIHEASGRKGAFIAANASAFPESLVESELFGHVRGAFTGAAMERKGLFEAAQGGTFFLDEVGDLPLPMQAKLLRTLEERAVKRVGSTELRKVDVRFVAATNRDLARDAAAGAFRKDLFFRLSVHVCEIPPLRRRSGDVPLLASHFLRRRLVEWDKSFGGFDAEAVRALVAYDWPGNVRELDNEMQRAASLVPDGKIVAIHHLSAPIRAATGTRRSPGLFSDVETLERTRIADALASTGGNQAQAGALLGMTRQALRYKLLKYGINPRQAT